MNKNNFFFFLVFESERKVEKYCIKFPNRKVLRSHFNLNSLLLFAFAIKKFLFVIVRAKFETATNVIMRNVAILYTEPLLSRLAKVILPPNDTEIRLNKFRKCVYKSLPLINEK